MFVDTLAMQLPNITHRCYCTRALFTTTERPTTMIPNHVLAATATWVTALALAPTQPDYAAIPAVATILILSHALRPDRGHHIQALTHAAATTAASAFIIAWAHLGLNPGPSLTVCILLLAATKATAFVIDELPGHTPARAHH